MTNPSRRELSRTEEWLRSHEEWPVPNDDLRAKVMRHASSAQLQARETNHSPMIPAICILFCGALTWFMQDIASGMRDPSSSAVLAVADDGWLRPIEQHITHLASGSPRSSFDWTLVQAHHTWRQLVYQRLNRVMWQ